MPGEEGSTNWKKKYNIWQPLILSCMVVVGMYIGFRMDDNLHSFKIIDSQDSTSYVKPGKLDELVRYVDAKYVDKIDQEDLTRTAIDAILEELDPHSAYFDGNRLRDLKEKMQGNFKGIGVRVYRYKDSIRVIDLNSEGPAKKAGVEKDDVILAINDTIITNSQRSLPEITDLIKSAEQDPISLNILRAGEKLRIEVGREVVPLKSVEEGIMIDEKTGLIKLIRFSNNTYREFMEELEYMVEHESLKNLIIDVRGNPGGYLLEAVNILSQLIPEEKKMLVYTEGRSARKNEYKSTGRNFFQIDKIAVLIDEGSASGSEILAGAIQDLDRGIIIGRRSFGKGLVQEQYELSDGSAIRLTIARYYTPSGRLIQRDYADLKEYDSEYSRRYDSGELFFRDSIKIVDTTMFTTSEGRVVYGGGGILPDIFIPIDKYVYEETYQELFQSVEAFAYGTYLKEKAEVSDYDNFSKIYADQAITDRFLEYLNNDELSSGLKVNSNVHKRILNEIKARLANFHFDSKMSLSEYAKSDKAISEAIKAFSKGSSLATMLED